MSKEIVSAGYPSTIEWRDRSFGGASREVFKVDDQTGDVSIWGVKVNGASQTYVVKKKLTATQILALAATPIQVIPKPTPGKYVEVVSVHAYLKYGSAAYAAVASTDFLQLRYTDGSGSLLTQNVDPSTFATATADSHLLLQAASTSVPLNAKVVASLAGAWTTGDSPITLEVIYRLRDMVI